MSRLLLFTICFALFFSTNLFAGNALFPPSTNNTPLFNQVKKPSVLLFPTIKEINKAKNIYQLTLLVQIPKGFHIYSFEKQGEFAPHQTKLSINLPWQAQNKSKPQKPKLLFDAAFKKKLVGYQFEFTVSQQIILQNKKQKRFPVSGNLSYQICGANTCFTLQKTPFQVQHITH